MIVFISALFSHPEVNAQAITNNTSVRISGEVTTSLDLNLADLDLLPQTEVTRKDKDGKDHIYSGVILSALLQKAGVPFWKGLNGKNLTKYVLIEAGDGYQVIFALAETDKDFTDRAIILADRVNKKSLPVGEGPFRIIVQDEKKQARCIRMVTAIKYNRQNNLR